MTVLAGPVDASGSRAPSVAGYPVTTSSGRAGARPAVSTYGVSAALLQPWATALRFPRAAGTDTSPIAARTPGTAASRAASAELTRARSLSATSWSAPTVCCPVTTAAVPA